MTEWAILAFPMIRRTLLAIAVASVSLPLSGVLAVALNLSNVRFTLMHVGFLGAAVSLALGINPLAGTLASILIGSLLMGPVSDILHLDTSAASGLFMVGSMACAFIVFYRFGVPAMEAFGVLNGNILALTTGDLWVIIGLGVIEVAVILALRWPIQVVLSGPETAEAMGLRVNIIRFVILGLIGLAVGVAMKIVGAFMVDSLVLLPAMAAAGFGRSLRKTIGLAAALGLLSGLGGFGLALAADLPVSASIGIFSVIVILACRVWRKRERPTGRA